jgi:tRNA modification GTPase
MVERLGIEVAEQQVINAAVVLVCGDSVESLSAAIESVRRLTTAPLIAIGTKSDTGGIPDDAVAALLALHRVSGNLAYVAVSARTGDGLDALGRGITEILERDRAPLAGDNPVLTRERHRVALASARSEVAAFVEIWTGASGLPATVVAVHLYSARGHLEELVGVLDVEDVLDRVFSSFCVGK